MKDGDWKGVRLVMAPPPLPEGVKMLIMSGLKGGASRISIGSRDESHDESREYLEREKKLGKFGEDAAIWRIKTERTDGIGDRKEGGCDDK